MESLFELVSRALTVLLVIIAGFALTVLFALKDHFEIKQINYNESTSYVPTVKYQSQNLAESIGDLPFIFDENSSSTSDDNVSTSVLQSGAYIEIPDKTIFVVNNIDGESIFHIEIVNKENISRAFSTKHYYQKALNSEQKLMKKRRSIAFYLGDKVPIKLRLLEGTAYIKIVNGVRCVDHNGTDIVDVIPSNTTIEAFLIKN